jgi:Ala-tRNA(Pro) deacylase
MPSPKLNTPSIAFSRVDMLLHRRVGHGNCPDIAKVFGCQKHPIRPDDASAYKLLEGDCEGLSCSGDCVAKGVLLRDETGYALAILPASHHIRLSELRSQLGDDVDLATEYEAAELFSDCSRGALPALGECYGLDMLVDDSIEKQPEVYFEAGDHGTLIHMSHAQFATLTATARHGRFSVHD